MMLRAAAGESLSVAMETLRHLSRESQSEWLRCDAAKTLARLAFDVATKTRAPIAGSGAKGEQRDLFDAATGLGPWKLTVIK